MSSRSDRDFVAALAHGISVLNAFDGARRALTLSEVARRADIAPATARRSLHTLQVLGYVRASERRFAPTARILSLGLSYLHALGAEEIFMPELRRLVEIFGEAASVAVLDGNDVIYLAHVSAQRALRPTATVGMRYPAYATSLGRVLLADLSDDELAARLQTMHLEKLTSETQVDKERLLEVCCAVRKLGYATVVDQLAYGVTALAVPIRINGPKAIAAINTSGYSGRSTAQSLVEERLGELRISAGRLEAALMHHQLLCDFMSSATRVSVTE